MYKICTKCGLRKRITSFGIRKNKKWTGYNSRCKFCEAKYKREYVRKWWKKTRLQRRIRWRAKKDKYRKIIIEAKNKPCLDCGKTYPYYVMQFDHRDKKDKKFELSTCPLTSMEKLIKEIAKCDVVCANCHAIRTFNEAREIKDSNP